MITKSSTKKLTNTLLLMLLIMGAALIVFLFFFLIPSDKRTNITWLNFGVILWLEVLLFGMFRFFSSQARKHEEVLPAFFTSAVVTLVYSILAIIILLLSFANLGFKALVTVHLVLFFVFFVTEIIVYLATRVAHDVVQEEREKKEGIQTIRREMDLLSMKVNRLPNSFSETKKIMAELAEDVRYTSPNNKSQAQKYEQDMLLKVDELRKLIGININSEYILVEENAKALMSTINNKLMELKDIVALRKQVLA